MASRAANHRWLLRDLPLAYVALLCAALVIGGLIYFIDWSSNGHEAATKSPLNSVNEQQRYIGSLILPTHGGRCQEMTFDNRTGGMVEKGDVDCDKAAKQLAKKNLPEGMEAARLRNVGKAFK